MTGAGRIRESGLPSPRRPPASTRCGRPWGGSTARSATGTWSAPARRWRSMCRAGGQAGGGAVCSEVGGTPVPEDAGRLPLPVGTARLPLCPPAPLPPCPSARLTWYLWLDTPRPGFLNMAIDETLLRLAEVDRSGFLRLYAWTPACLSFGRHEPALRRYCRDRIEARGIDVVRRPTGGRAVWHDIELTYSVA